MFRLTCLPIVLLLVVSLGGCGGPSVPSELSTWMSENEVDWTITELDGPVKATEALKGEHRIWITLVAARSTAKEAGDAAIDPRLMSVEDKNGARQPLTGDEALKTGVLDIATAAWWTKRWTEGLMAVSGFPLAHLRLGPSKICIYGTRRWWPFFRLLSRPSLD